MEAKYKAAEDMQRHLAQTIAYEVQEDLQLGASDMGRDIASSLTNTPLSRLSQPKKPRIVDADKVAPTQAASKEQVLDPYKVKPEVDSERKSLPEKASLWERIKGTVDFSVPDDTETATEEAPIEQESIDTDSLPENYLDWTDTQWKQAKDELTKEQYDELFDDAFPAEGLKPTPTKRTGGKQAGKAKKPLPKTGKRGA
jgi:hypothetical protein